MFVLLMLHSLTLADFFPHSVRIINHQFLPQEVIVTGRLGNIYNKRLYRLRFRILLYCDMELVSSFPYLKGCMTVK